VMERLEGRRQAPAVAVILAAGLGSRLGPETNRPKPLTEVLGLTLAERVVCALHEGGSIRRFIVTLGHEPRARRESIGSG